MHLRHLSRIVTLVLVLAASQEARADPPVAQVLPSGATISKPICVRGFAVIMAFMADPADERHFTATWHDLGDHWMVHAEPKPNAELPTASAGFAPVRMAVGTGCRSLLLR